MTDLPDTAAQQAEDLARAEEVVGEPLNVSHADAARVKWWHFSDEDLREIEHWASVNDGEYGTDRGGLWDEVKAEIERRAA